MSFIGWSQNVARQFKSGVLGWLNLEPTLYNYFRANGLKENVGEGQTRLTYLKAIEPKGGMLTNSMHNWYTDKVRWDEVTTGLDYLNLRVIISREDVDKHRTGKWLRGDLVQDTLDMEMPKIINQWDQLLAWGEEYADSPTDLEFTSENAGTITGIFNGGTTYDAGLGGDKDMQTADDYLDTVDGMIQALRTAKHVQDKYLLLSDETTWRYAGNENQFYSTVGITERQRIMERKDIFDWMHSPNFADDSGVKYRMAMIAPKPKRPPIKGKGPNNNISLYVGYDNKVLFDYEGGMGNLHYVMYIINSFKLVEHRSTAIQRTDTLTLT
jgi:hypothetical protein